MSVVEKNFHVTVAGEFSSLGQKIYFQAVVLPEVASVLEKYSDDLVEIGELDKEERKNG